MENSDGTFTCLHCTRTFARRHPCGRKPHYCSATCRQRAYETRRRGARYPTPTALSRLTAARTPPHHYEAGRHKRLYHALRPDGLPDRTHRRQTLCGSWALPVRPPFGRPTSHPDRNCQTCQAVALAHPPGRTVNPSHDLAVLTHLITRLPRLAENEELFTYLALSNQPPPQAGPARAG